MAPLLGRKRDVQESAEETGKGSRTTTRPRDVKMEVDIGTP